MLKLYEWDGVKILLDEAVAVQNPVVGNGLNYETHVRAEMLRIVPQCTVMYDLGSNVGIHTVSAKQINPALRVFCFDAMALNCQQLLKTIGLNNWTDVYVLPVALGDHDGMMGINGDPSNPTCGKHGQFFPHWVSTFRLDSFDFPMPQFVKMDVEGCELDVLQGASKMLAARPRIISEYNLPLLQPKGIAEAYVDFLLAHDYVVTMLDYHPGMRCNITSGAHAVEHVMRTSGAIGDLLAEPK